MNNNSEIKSDKKKRLGEIKELINGFCKKYLNKELEGYAIKLCDKLGRKRKIDILRGKKEIWAASIVNVIARLNFLFDKNNEISITVETINNFFTTKKRTIGSKATQIEKDCSLIYGALGYCSKEITDSFTYYQTPEGFIIPRKMIDDGEIIIEIATDKEAEEIKKYSENQRLLKEQKIKEKKEKRIEINRAIAEKKKKEKDDNDRQLTLF